MVNIEGFYFISVVFSFNKAGMWLLEKKIYLRGIKSVETIYLFILQMKPAMLPFLLF